MEDIDISEKDLYWLAGFLEGEGSFSPPRKRATASRSPRLSVGTTDRDVIDRAALLLGQGSKVYERRVEVGCKPFFALCVQSKRATAWMKLLRPLMGTRRQGQIDAAIEGTPEYLDLDCKWCGERIPAGTRGRRTYCSHECGDLGNAQRKREYMAEYRKRVVV